MGIAVNGRALVDRPGGDESDGGARHVIIVSSIQRGNHSPNHVEDNIRPKVDT
jgi:hypothetical protein